MEKAGRNFSRWQLTSICMMMMWVLLFVLVATDYAGATDDDCRRDTGEVCKLGDLTMYITKSVAERNSTTCKTLLENAECIIRVEEKCHFHKNLLKMAKTQLPVLKRICGSETEETGFPGSREQGFIFWRSLECPRLVVNEKRGYCASTPCKFKLIKYAEALLKKGIISDVDINTLLCLGELNTFTCLAVAVENKCGKFAFNQYMNEMEDSTPRNIMSTCGDLQFKDAFPTMLEVYKENEQAENLLRSVLKKPGF